MEYDEEENGFISVPAPEFGAIFMSNIATKRDCFKHKVFGLPSSMANFVKEVKKGMVLFLFEYERRQLFGVYRAISDGEMNIVPHAFSSSGKQFSAQVRFMPIWYCSPLSENEFRDAILENYFSARKFHFGLSDEQVHRLLKLFSSRKLKNTLPPRKLTTGVSNRDEEDHIMVVNNVYAASGGFDTKPSNVDLEPSQSRGYPRLFRGVKSVNDDVFLIEHTVEDEDKVDFAEHVYYNDKKRRIHYDGRLLRDNAPEDKLHVHSLAEEIGFSGDDWSSLNDRVNSEYKINTNYTPLVSNYRRDSNLRRTPYDENLVVRDQIVNENNVESSFGLGRSNGHHGKPSDGNRTRLGTHYADSLRNNSVEAQEKAQEPALSRKNRGDAFWNDGTVSDARCSSLDNGRLFTSEISGNESKFRTGLGRGFDYQAATDDECFYSRHEGANKKCVDHFLIPAASNGNPTYGGDVGRQVAEVGSYPLNDFNWLVPCTENFRRPLTSAERTAYSPMKKRTSGYSTEFLAVTKSPHSTEAQNLGPTSYGHTSTYEVEQRSNFVQKSSSYNVHRENNFSSSKGISSPYSYPEFTNRGLGSASEDGKNVLLRSQDGFKNPLNVGISEAMEPNRSGSFGYTTAFIPRPSISQQFSRDNVNEDESWRFSSIATLDSIACHSFSDNYQRADEQLVDEHVIWQRSNGTHVGRRSGSPNTSRLLHQGNVLTNVDHANSPGADIINDEYKRNILTDVAHSDSRNSRGSVFARLSLAPKVRLSREQEANHCMSYNEYYMDTTVDEIMDMLYEDQNIVPKKLLNRKPFVRKGGNGETNRSGKHAAVVKNDPEQPGDSMMRVLRKSANEAPVENVNHVLAETRVVDFKRRRETNRASEETNAKCNKEEKSNANEHMVHQNAQESSSETAVAKDSADKPLKRRKLVRPVFDESYSKSDMNHQLPCQELGKG